MFGKKELDVIELRKDAELSGLLTTKRGLTIFYTTYLGMDIEEAEPKIRKECECRDIPFEAPAHIEQPEKGTFEKVDTVFGQINAMAEKYPIVKDTFMPMFSQFLAGSLTTLVGVVTGKKIEDNNDYTMSGDADFEQMELAETPTVEQQTNTTEENEDIQDGVAGGVS